MVNNKIVSDLAYINDIKCCAKIGAELKRCIELVKKFSKDIKETFELTNGNLEGIEKLSVWEYGLEHDIHKHFSDRPCIE